MNSKTYIQADETTIKVLGQTKKGKTHLGYYWVYYAVLQNILIFDYQKGRGKSVPKGILQDICKQMVMLYISGYAKKKGVTHLGCAHARRKFEKALSNDKEKAEFIMLKLQELYKIERTAMQEALNGSVKN